jgi:hypothetical protein
MTGSSSLRVPTLSFIAENENTTESAGGVCDAVNESAVESNRTQRRGTRALGGVGCVLILAAAAG